MWIIIKGSVRYYVFIKFARGLLGKVIHQDDKHESFDPPDIEHCHPHGFLYSTCDLTCWSILPAFALVIAFLRGVAIRNFERRASGPGSAVHSWQLLLDSHTVYPVPRYQYVVWNRLFPSNQNNNASNWIALTQSTMAWEWQTSSSRCSKIQWIRKFLMFRYPSQELPTPAPCLSQLSRHGR